MERIACAAYLASFLARAAFVPERCVVQTVQQLAGWCLDYALTADAVPSGDGPSWGNDGSFGGGGVRGAPDGPGVKHQVSCSGRLGFWGLEPVFRVFQHVA